MSRETQHIDCLDGGFVELVSVYPEENTEAAIVRAARVSYAGDQEEHSVVRDQNLIKYLITERHTSPLEMVEFTFHICAPISIIIHFLRHRTANINSISHRYTPADKAIDKEFPWHKPVSNIEDVRLQSKISKQCSSLELNQNEDLVEIFEEMDDLTQKIYSCYQQLIAAGVAKEQARFYLPCGTYTRIYFKMDLHNLLHLLSLRMAPDAQLETRIYANAMYDLIKDYVPSAIEAFENSRLEAITFTQEEIKVIKDPSLAEKWSLRKKLKLQEKVEIMGISLDLSCT